MIKTFGISDVGMKRKNNEDAYLIERVDIYENGKKRIFYVLVVADGMGGHAAGEVASGMVVERFTAAPLTYLAGKLDGIKKIIEFVNRKVYEKSKKMDKKMGTTLVAAILEGHRGFIFNVGDSRAYLFRNDKLTRITHDHSVIQEMLDKNVITEEEARTHPQRHVITMAVGTKEKVEPDMYPLKFQSGDVLLMCSDGVHDMLTDEEIEKIMIKNKGNLANMGKAIIKGANDHGGKDNITVVLAEL
ncbi:MAG: Stp1/IreP family PP2C-type Ser/Thr phosphatase [Euryarchaeota archaeon]|nr:Stp1/IreP family PP2C-type Ser/Thr phosphatase [Euryarchaeota archaeon]